MSRAWRLVSGRPWRGFRGWVLERDGYVCQLRLPGCTGTATCVDHIVPLSVDPTRMLDPANARAACRDCNSRRRDTPDHLLPRHARASRPW